jgi:hypothetical protein
MALSPRAVRGFLFALVVYNAVGVANGVRSHWSGQPAGSWILRAEDVTPHYDPAAPTSRPVLYVATRSPKPTIPPGPDYATLIIPCAFNLTIAGILLAARWRTAEPRSVRPASMA